MDALGGMEVTLWLPEGTGIASPNHKLCDAPSLTVGRIVPCCGFIEFTSHEKLLVSEISWSSLGMIFSFHPSGRIRTMEKISACGRPSFKQRSTIQLTLPSLEVSTPFPLVYGGCAAAERERNERDHAYLIQAPSIPGREIDVAAQLR